MSTDDRVRIEGACIIRQTDGSFLAYVHGPNRVERGRGVATTMIEALAKAIDASERPVVTDAMVDAFAREWYGVPDARPNLTETSRDLAREAIAAAMKAGAK